MTPAAQQPEYTCDQCQMFACPVAMKYPKTKGCNQGKDVMEQIRKSKKTKSRDFDDICKELGI
jgi:hypothetical protein